MEVYLDFPLATEYLCRYEKELCPPNVEDPCDPSPYRHFRGRTLPQISLRKYVERFKEYADFDDSVFITASIHLSRLRRRMKRDFDEACIHRLVAVALLVAMKCVVDCVLKSDFYAKIVGITVQELVELELRYVEMMRYELFVPTSEFVEHCAAFRERIASLSPDPAQCSSPSSIPSPVLTALPPSHSTFPVLTFKALTEFDNVKWYDGGV